MPHPFCSGDCCIVELSALRRAWMSDVSVRRCEMQTGSDPSHRWPSFDSAELPCNCHLGDLKSLPDRSH